jgi:DNA-binding FadR family transcriptional regulator
MAEQKLKQRYSLFNRRELRERTGWSETQTRLHLERLEGMKFINRRTGKQGRICKYKLLIEPPKRPRLGKSASLTSKNSARKQV